MKKLLILLSMLTLPIFAADNVQMPTTPVKQVATLNQYFEYLPNAVHNNWTPYKANQDYEVTVQFRVKKNGEITEPFIVNSTNKNAPENGCAVLDFIFGHLCLHYKIAFQVLKFC